MERALLDAMAEVEDAHWWFTGRRAILARVLEALMAGRRVRTCDVGAGAGGNLPMLAALGPVTALEADPALAARARERGVAEVHAWRDPEPLPVPTGAFDLVTAFDVLEHLDDDARALRAMAALLASGGRIVVTVPAHPWLWSRHDEVHHHRRRYTRASLRAAAAAAGLAVERLSAFNTLLFAPAAAARLAARATGLGRASADRIGPANGLLRAVFGLEARWLARRDLPVGLSLLAVLAPRAGAAGRERPAG